MGLAWIEGGGVGQGARTQAAREWGNHSSRCYVIFFFVVVSSSSSSWSSSSRISSVHRHLRLLRFSLSFRCGRLHLGANPQTKAKASTRQERERRREWKAPEPEPRGAQAEQPFSSNLPAKLSCARLALVAVSPSIHQSPGLASLWSFSPSSSVLLLLFFCFVVVLLFVFRVVVVVAFDARGMSSSSSYGVGA